MVGFTGIALLITALKIIHEQRIWKVIIANLVAMTLYLPIYKYAYFPAWAHAENSIKAIVAFL